MSRSNQQGTNHIPDQKRIYRSARTSHRYKHFYAEMRHKNSSAGQDGALTFKIACSAPSLTAGYLRRASAERARRSDSNTAMNAIASPRIEHRDAGICSDRHEIARPPESRAKRASSGSSGVSSFAKFCDVRRSARSSPWLYSRASPVLIFSTSGNEMD